MDRARTVAVIALAAMMLMVMYGNTLVAADDEWWDEQYNDYGEEDYSESGYESSSSSEQWFIDTSYADFKHGTPANTEAWYPGEVKMIIERGTWIDKNQPTRGNYGVALTNDGSYIYIFKSWVSGDYYFKRYDSSNNWTDLPAPPYRPKTGCDLAWDGGDFIYALLGGAYDERGDTARKYFMRYSISGQTWEPLRETPERQHAGASLVWVEGGAGGYIYAFIGGGGEAVNDTERNKANMFLKYDISQNTWSEVRSLPSPLLVDDGADLVWTRNDFIYAFTGAYGKTPEERKSRYDFLKYNL